jgi:hypothetical protein
LVVKRFWLRFGELGFTGWPAVQRLDKEAVHGDETRQLIRGRASHPSQGDENGEPPYTNGQIVTISRTIFHAAAHSSTMEVEQGFAQNVGDDSCDMWERLPLSGNRPLFPACHNR